MSVNKCLRLALEYCDILRCYQLKKFDQVAKKLHNYPNKNTVNNLLELFKKEEIILEKFKNLKTSTKDGIIDPDKRIIRGYLDDGKQVRIMFYHYDDEITQPLLTNKRLFIRFNDAYSGRWTSDGLKFDDCDVKTENTDWVACKITIVEKIGTELGKYTRSQPTDIYNVKSTYPDSIKRDMKLLRESGAFIDEEVERMFKSGYDFRTILKYSLEKKL